MFNFGFGSKQLGGALNCSASGLELLNNSLFDCGLDSWQVYPGTTGTLVDNADGTITLTAADAYASIEPVVFPITDATELYYLKTSISGLSGAGKISIMIDTTWSSTGFDTTGTYIQEFKGNLTEMVVGADADATMVMTYNSISVQKVVGPAQITTMTLTPGDTTITMDWTAPDANGSPITKYDLFLDGVWFGEVPPEQLTAEMTSLVNGREYSMDVRAVNANGQGNPTNKTTATPNLIVYVVDDNGNQVIDDDGSLVIDGDA